VLEKRAVTRQSMTIRKPKESQYIGTNIAFPQKLEIEPTPVESRTDLTPPLRSITVLGFRYYGPPLSLSLTLRPRFLGMLHPSQRMCLYSRPINPVLRLLVHQAANRDIVASY